MKKALKVFGSFVGGVGLFTAGFMVANTLSPKPGARLIKRLFQKKEKITHEKTYQIAAQQVSVQHNLEYPSRFQANQYDLYLPKNSTAPGAVLIWIHGGGYVGGDKNIVKEFATKLVADTKIAVVSMNYQLAPSSQYPNQLLQVCELYQALQQVALPQLALTRLFVGGDSAGAQIALQFIQTQVDSSYGQAIGVPTMMSATDLKGAISYCGPVDLQQAAAQSEDSKLIQSFMRTVAWSLTGTKNWQENPKLLEASLVAHVTANFPPTYLTDGNMYSFQEQGLALATRLAALKVPVTTLFFKERPQPIYHEYQFDYSTPEAQQCYQGTVEFVEKYQ